MAKDFRNAAGTKLLQQVAQANTEKLNASVIVNIELDKIVPNPDNERIFNMDNIESIARSIEEDGFTGAIEVFKMDDGTYQINAGHRRYEAMKMLGRKTIPCVISNDVDDVTKARKLLSSNLTNRVLNPFDYANAIEYYKTKVGAGRKVPKEELCEFFNLSRPQLFRYECIKKLIPELQEYTKDSMFPFTGFQSAVNLDKEQQYRLLGEIQTYKKDNPEFEISRATIEQMISTIKGRDARLKQKEEKERIEQEQKLAQEKWNRAEDEPEEEGLRTQGESYRGGLEQDTSHGLSSISRPGMIQEESGLRGRVETAEEHIIYEDSSNENRAVERFYGALLSSRETINRILEDGIPVGLDIAKTKKIIEEIKRNIAFLESGL